MPARYSLRPVGVFDAVLGRVITRTDAEWSDYRQWLRANAPDPMPVVPPPPPTQAELDARAEIEAIRQLRDVLRNDSGIRALATRSPAQVEAWIEGNVTTLAQAREVLKTLAKVTSWIIRSQIPAPPS